MDVGHSRAAKVCGKDSGKDAGHASEELDEALENLAAWSADESLDRADAGDDPWSSWSADVLERFFVVSKWVSKVRHFQHNLRRSVKRPSEIKETLQNVSAELKARQQAMMKSQQAMMNSEVKKVAAKLRSAKVSQHRHITCFVASTADVIIHAFWMGYSPLTVHHWYTFKMVPLILARFAFFRYKGWHFFLVDMCYYSNYVTLVYLWILRDRPWLFQAAYGYSGMMLFSIVAFRNSFVPHSLDRMTSLHVHLGPVLTMWVVKWQSEGLAKKGFATSDAVGLYYVYGVYLLWSLTYSLFMFGFDVSNYKEGKCQSLYTMFAYDYGCLNAIPAWSRPFAPVPFMLGHAMLFSTGLLYLALPFEAQTACIMLCILWAIRNGATFYMTYFWKVYDQQIHEAERQMAKAQAAMERSCSPGREEDAKSNVGEKETIAEDAREPISTSSEETTPPRRRAYSATVHSRKTHKR